MITMVTGGARSGKSSFAESLYRDSSNVVYIATARIYDDEMQSRVQKHIEQRPVDWRTFEGSYHLFEALGEEENYILDCLTVLSSNIMFDISKNADRISNELEHEIETTILSEVYELISQIRERGKNLVIVTNEVGDSIVPDNHIGRVFRDIQGRVNQKIASFADEVYLVCVGIPLRLK